jgi:YHS domain-containing protein
MWPLLAVLALPACDEEAPCTKCGEQVAVKATVRLEPWLPANATFNGCARGCGVRATGPVEGVKAQPGAMLGQLTYCPVSGVVFEVQLTSARRDLGGRTLYFCCESCAQYFSQNQAEIMAMRGLG